MKKHKTRTFPKEEMLELIDDNSTQFKLIQDEILDHSRWSVMHEIVFQDVVTCEYFRAYYSVGATEDQDESPWDYEDEVIASLVEPKPVTVTQYFPVEQEEFASMDDFNLANKAIRTAY